MAEEKIQVEAPELISAEEVKSKLHVADPEVPDYFANISNASIGQSEITLFFGRQFEELTGEALIKGLCRVTLSHDNFTQMMAHWNRHAAFLAKAYGENQPALRTIRANHPEQWEKAVEEFKQPPYLLTNKPNETQDETE